VKHGAWGAYAFPLHSGGIFAAMLHEREARKTVPVVSFESLKPLSFADLGLC
jgi:hypothetical protein